MSTEGKRRRGLTYEDRVLWTHVASSIKPLRAKARNVADESDDGAAETPKPPAKQPPKFKKLASVAQPTATPRATSKLAAPSLETLTRRMRQRVAKGKYAIDARLDLHGFTQSEAHSVLLRFLRTAHQRDARLVLVITGKGRGGEMGVLRRHVPQWLALPEFRELVVGFEDAAITHGGEGALYVRVRRSRGE